MLKELSFKACNGYREWNWDTWDDQRIPKNSLNLLIDNLTTLDVTDLEMSLDEARCLVFALQKNDTITDLTLPFCTFRCRLREGFEPISEYLVRSSSLRKLTLRSRTKCCALDELMVEAMCDMRMIMVQQLAEVVARNNFLRCVRLPSTVCGHCVSPDDKYAPCTFPKANMSIFCVASALSRRDSNLHELSVDLAGCNEEECEVFLRSATRDVVLRSVTVYSLPRVNGIDRICGIISRFLYPDLVTIKNVCVDQTVANVLLYCPEITAVTLTASHFLLEEDNLQPVIRALDVISRCGHVTSLRVDCSRFDRAAFSALARCIRGPSPLMEVDINFGSCWTEIVDDECYEIEAELFLALASNMNLAKLSLSGALVSRNNLKLLAGSAHKSRYLTDFRLAPVCVSDTWEHGFCTWHVAEQSSAPSNYKNAALVAIQEITRRNMSLVEAAVQYVLSEKEAKTGAQVIELMHSHPRFLEMLQQAANTSKVRAKGMTSDALSRIRKTSLDEFMRLAGVVKRKVKCCGKCGAGKQLVDMRGKCWLHIRSFLKISDVVRP
ncbi:hypothetical protein HPB50_000333 [Hyalomma asiaticum]|uniref:Uncharacterized protein n=1 Tax=Hyalomma asiaticum TaxID=266040 RepID=A0ACB7T742_HYAAI|nr:hypothetical protein HPB50_000333 [Hyalomma asiaticum]